MNSFTFGLKISFSEIIAVFVFLRWWGNLRTHLKTDSGEKSKKCNQCEYACSGLINLRKYFKTHSGEKSNKCNQCDYSSSRADALRRHLKMHSVEKPNKCNQCDYASLHASHLKRHLKTHSEKSTKCKHWKFKVENKWSQCDIWKGTLKQSNQWNQCDFESIFGQVHFMKRFQWT